MELATIIELISTLGFPIVAVIAMGYFIFKIYKKSEDREDKLMLSLEECRKINAEAITTIASYADKLDTIQKDITDIKTELTVLTTTEQH